MKKLVVLLLVFLCAFSIFAAGAKEAAPAAGVAELKGPGKVTLKRLGYNVDFDVNKNYMVPIMEDVTGYKVEYFALPAQDADEKLLLEVASGKDYDMVNLSIDQFRSLVGNRALMPLNDLLNKYGKDIYDGNSKETWEALSGEDGNIYGVPYMYPYDTEVSNFMAARMDLIRAVGYNEIPTKLDDFYDMLVKLKQRYGNQYIILTGPYVNASNGSNSLSFPQIISSAFGIYNDWMVDENGKVFYMAEHERFPDLVEFLAKLAREGLLDSDWAANTVSSVTEKFASGRAIIACSDRNLAQAAIPALMTTYGLKPDDFGFVSALEGADGTCTYLESTSVGKVTAILRTSKNAADAMNWMNIKVQNQLFINIGVEGIHFNYDAIGSIDPINPIFGDERGDSYYYLDATDAEMFKVQWPSRIRKSEAQWLAFDGVTIKTNRDRPEIFIPNQFAFMPATHNFARYNTTLLNSLNDFVLQVMAGTRSSRDIPTYLRDWKNNGGDDVRAELQEFLASK